MNMMNPRALSTALRNRMPAAGPGAGMPTQLAVPMAMAARKSQQQPPAGAAAGMPKPGKSQQPPPMQTAGQMYPNDPSPQQAMMGSPKSQQPPRMQVGPTVPNNMA